MATLGLYEILEIVFGLIFFWVGIYLLSKNPFSKLSWATFGVLLCWSIIIGTDPIHTHSRSLAEFIIWQKVLNLPLFFGAVIFFNTSAIIRQTSKMLNGILLYSGYAIMSFFYGLSLFTQLVFKNEIMTNDFRYTSVLPAGKLFVVLLFFVYTYLLLTVFNYLKAVKEGANKQYILPALTCLSCILLATTKGISYYHAISYINLIFNTEVALVAISIVYAIIKFDLYITSERIFNRTFFYQTVGIVLIALVYLSAFIIFDNPLTFQSLIYITILLAIVLTTHSFYDWLSTFINDLLYNSQGGFSVVNDEEISTALRNYESPSKLEESPLLRLKIVNKNSENGKVVDRLKNVIEESIEFFKPKSENAGRRTKRNIKYHLLKMIAYDQSEEGQILWELGFDEYPVAIMTRENKDRKPMFQTKSPSDYFYTSRNAYLALKKEAIHDVTWRISYLEKLAKKS